MKVIYVKQSRGFSFGVTTANFVTKDIENAELLKKLKEEKIVDLPLTVARDISNLVDVITGLPVNPKNGILLSKEECIQKYKIS